MTIYNINFTDNNGARPTPSGWNMVETFTLGHTQSLLGSADENTGVSLEITSGFTGSTGSTDLVTEDSFGVPADVWRGQFYAGAGSGAVKLKGLPSGKTYSLKVAALGANAARDTDFTVGVTTLRYDSLGSGNPSAPVEFTGTVDGLGEISLSQEIVDSFSYLSFIQLEVADAPTSLTLDNVTVEPSPTLQYVTVAGADNSETSLFYGSTPPVVDGDQFEAPLFTDQGKDLTLSPSGSVSIANTGLEVQTFQYRVYDVDVGEWSNYATATITPTDGGEPVPDTEKPVITLIGSASVTVSLGSTYTDQGANVTDNVDADAVLVAQGSVNTNQLGVYSLTYDYTDAAGNIADTVYRTVEVVDVKPTIVLNGASTINHIINTTYTDAGAVAHDDVDVDVSITAVGTVNTTLEGVYTLTYDHTDTDTNAADTVYRTVNVFDPEASTGTGTDAVLGSVLT